MFKIIKRTLIAVFAAVVIGLIGTAWWLFAPHTVAATSILVEPGDPFYRVVVKLRDREVISSPWFFSKVGIIINLDQHTIPGRYDFEGRLSNFSIIRKLWRGEITFMSFTIPEGYTLGQIGELLYQSCGTDRDRFDSLVRDSLFLKEIGIYTGFAEGYLFPETYRFEWGIGAEEAIEAMASQFYARIDTSLLARSAALGYSLHDLITMASIVQKEGRDRAEFGKIASVYRNRYEIGMKLQADPTVIYGMGGLDRPLYVRDYKFPSEYNTYLHEGLPPTPICSPGMDAIRAALYPDTTDYLYFVADGNGRHIFSKTYREHLRAISSVKRK